MSRLSPGTVIVAIFAVLFGLVGAYAVRESLKEEPQAEAPPEPQLNLVPVASIDIEPGRALTLGDIALLRLTNEQMREREIPGGYMTNTQQIIGRTLRDPVPEGEPFFTTQFFPQGMGPSIADRLKPGLRAVTVPITPTAAVSGMTTPGTFVDVLFRNTPSPEDDLPATTVTLLESVEVLAIGQDIVPGARPPARVQEVTLAVSPEQASALNVVENRGDLMLALRSPQDLEYISDPQPQTLHSLLGLVEPGPPVMTEIYRGRSMELHTFESERPATARVTSVPLRSRGTTQTSTTVPPQDDESAPADEAGDAAQQEQEAAAAPQLKEVKHPAPVSPRQGDSAPGQVNRNRPAETGVSAVIAPAVRAPADRAPAVRALADRDAPTAPVPPMMSILNREPPLQYSPMFDQQAAAMQKLELPQQAVRVSKAFAADAE